MTYKSILALALCVVCLGTQAQTQRKRKDVKPIATEERVKPVDGKDFSYAMGVAESESLKAYLIQREGLDSLQLLQAAQALETSLQLSEAERKKALAYAAGLKIAMMNEASVVPSLNQSATGKKDTTYTDIAIFTRGLCDGLMQRNSISADSARKVADQQMNYYRQELKRANVAFLTNNAKMKGVKVLPSGLQYRVITQGKGAVANDTTDVEVHYEGKLIDGTIFDSSYQRGKTATFKPTQVIKGWTEALKMMPEGSTWELFIPYDLAYGERGNQNIPPFATLIFKVEVVKVKP